MATSTEQTAAAPAPGRESGAPASPAGRTFWSEYRNWALLAGTAFLLQTAFVVLLVNFLRLHRRSGRLLTRERDALDAKVAERTKELTRINESLRASEEKFARAFSSNPAAVQITRFEDGTLYDANDTWEELTGYDRKELLGLSVRDSLWPNHEAARRFLDTLAEAGSVRGSEQEFRRKSGQLFVTQLSAQLLTVQGERVVISTFVDVTEHRTFEERMLQTQKLESLGVLAGGIAHDFNNILQAILGNAELAAACLPPSAPGLDNLLEISRSAKRASDLTRQMLAYSGHGALQVRPQSLNSAILEIKAMLRLSVSRKAELDFRLGENVPFIEADLSQLRQVVMNLVINASEALGDATGTIRVVTGCRDCDRAFLAAAVNGGDLVPGRYVFLEVSDSGCGMDAATRARIFDPFFTTKFAGRGLGLAAVMGILRAHAGAIMVASEPGRGATFTLLFPACPTPCGPVAAAEPSAGPWKGRGTILLVDDEASVRNVGRRMLETLGFSVLVASDGSAAVQTFRQHSGEICAVILDLTMPTMDGEEALRQIRAISPNAMVILSSGYEAAWMGKGWDGFIQKPYELRKLESTLRGAFGAGLD